MEFTKGFSCLLKLIFALMLLIGAANAVCNVCQANNAACINTTSFHHCFGQADPDTSFTFHCQENFVCTEFNAICLQAVNTLKPSCGDNSKCSFCSAHINNKFACHSRTTYQMCYGLTLPVGPIANCPNDTVCDANSDSICVDKDKPHTITCDKPAPPEAKPTDPVTDLPPSTLTPPTEAVTPSTVTSPPITETPSTTAPTTLIPLTPSAMCEINKKAGLFPPTPNDPYCSRYIHCMNDNGLFKGTSLMCDTGTYYNIKSEQCVLVKPTYCI